MNVYDFGFGVSVLQLSPVDEWGCNRFVVVNSEVEDE